MVDIWKSVKRGLDSSLACLCFRYAYRQVSEDINQLALEVNIEAMRGALEMVRSAYKRIDKYAAKSDQAAKDAIANTIKRDGRFEIKV